MADAAATQELVELDIKNIHPDDGNLRLDANGDDLVASIKDLGVLQPITVRPGEKDGHFIVVAGHRRLDGAKKAGLKKLSAIVRHDNGTSVAVARQIMLVENLQRADLNLAEEAKGFAELVELGWSQREIADKTGFSPSVISRRIKVAALPEDVLAKVAAGQMSQEIAEALVPLFQLDPEQGRLAVDNSWQDWTIDRLVSDLKVKADVEKIGAKLTKAGLPWVPPSLVGKTGIDEDGATFIWEYIYDEVTEVDDEGVEETFEDVRRVGTGPLELAAALEVEGADGISVTRWGGKAELVVVHKEIIDAGDGTVADDEVPADAAEAAEKAEKRRLAAEKKKRQTERRHQAHDLEQYQAMVAGKLAKGDVADWVARGFLAGLTSDAQKQAAVYLQLEPVEVAPPYGDGKTTKDYGRAFTDAAAEATGVALTRVLMAGMLGELTKGRLAWGSSKEILAEVKEQLGFEEFDPTVDA